MNLRRARKMLAYLQRLQCSDCRVVREVVRGRRSRENDTGRVKEKGKGKGEGEEGDKGAIQSERLSGTLTDVMRRVVTLWRCAVRRR
jgi:hypothetical protein